MRMDGGSAGRINGTIELTCTFSYPNCEQRRYLPCGVRAEAADLIGLPGTCSDAAVRPTSMMISMLVQEPVGNADGLELKGKIFGRSAPTSPHMRWSYRRASSTNYKLQARLENSSVQSENDLGKSRVVSRRRTGLSRRVFCKLLQLHAYLGRDSFKVSPALSHAAWMNCGESWLS